MKKHITFFTLLFHIIVFAQEIQTRDAVKVTYNFIYDNGMMQNGATYSFDTELLITESVAQFIFNRTSSLLEGENEQMTVPDWFYINQYEFSKDSLSEQRRMEDGLLLKAKWKNQYEWKITDETKEIGGYKVIKAITPSVEVDKNNQFYYGNAIAWFTPDIPVPAGPARYVGLPGLILELEYENYKTKYTLKNIDFKSNEKLKDISEGYPVDKLDVLYFFHNDKDEIKSIQKEYKKNKK